MKPTLNSQVISIGRPFSGNGSEVEWATMDIISESLLHAHRCLQNFNSQGIDIILGNNTSKKNYLINLIGSESRQSVKQRLSTFALQSSKRLRLQISSLQSDIDSLYSKTCSLLDNDSSQSSIELNQLECLEDSFIQMERIWNFSEIVSFYGSPEVGPLIIEWLQNDYDDRVKLEAIKGFVAKYSESSTKILANNLSKSITSVEFENELYETTKSNFEDTLVWLCLRGHLTLLWSLFICFPEVHNIISQISNQNDISPIIQAISSFHALLSSHPYIGETRKESQGNSSTLEVWKLQIQSFLSSNSPILTKLPYTFVILQILAGKESFLLECCNGNWQLYQLVLLLYVYAPPLTKRDLLRLAEKSFLSMSQKCNMSERDVLVNKMFIGGLDGNSASLLRQLYELGQLVNSPANKIVALTCSGILSFLLSVQEAFTIGNTSSHVGLMSIMPQYPNEASFTEELLIELAEYLFSLNWPIELVIGYLDLCPVKGREYIRCFLLKTQPRTDEEALKCANLLKDRQFEEEARQILLARASFWWKRSTLRSRIYAESYFVTKQEVPISKAIYFFQLANAEERIKVILDFLFVRLATAVKQSDDRFIGLTFNPLRPSPPMVPGSSWFCRPDSSESYKLTKVPDMKYNKSDIDFNPYEWELNAALLDAQSALDGLRGNIVTSPDAIGLREYSSAIKTVIQAKKWDELAVAAKRIATITNDGTMLMRHCLHLLDIIVWFHNFKDTALKANSSDPENPVPLCLFLKSQAYDFLTTLFRLTSSFMFVRYLNGATDDDVQRIRNSLLLLFSDAVMLENKEVGLRQQLEREQAEQVDRNKLYQWAWGSVEEEEQEMIQLLSGGNLHLS